uniref:redesigned ubiquitin n=1 Tax=synthetic construct TaxID=32630 RepID=UPI00052238D4|nr:Chain A, redesigned ubiquitin [synthetic construct]
MDTINITLPDGKTLTLTVTPEFTVKELAEEIARRLGLSPEDIKLTHNGKTLDPSLTLAEYGITPGSTITLEIKKKGGLE